MKIYDVPGSPYRLILHNYPPASSIKALCQLMSHKIIGHIYDKKKSQKSHRYRIRSRRTYIFKESTYLHQHPTQLSSVYFNW